MLHALRLTGGICGMVLQIVPDCSTRGTRQLLQMQLSPVPVSMIQGLPGDADEWPN